MATIDDYNDMQYYEAFKDQFKSLESNIDITTPLGINTYLQYLNFIQNRRIAKELLEIRNELKSLKQTDGTQKP